MVTPAPADAPAAASPLSAVPQLHSYPSGKAQIYLDFVGAPAQSWGGRSVTATPAFDQDGDPTTFSAGELTAISQIFNAVAEAYSPFSVDVTTVAPASLVHKQNMEIVIGGNGAWSGGSYGGLSFTGAFANSVLPNVSWVFSQNLGNAPAYIGQATAHEAGHEFGLNHQSTYSGTTLTAEYNPGNSLTAPIMGVSYYAQRGLWWYGTSDISSSNIQDDMAVIASATNGFGYRPLTVGQSTGSATALALSSGSLSASGVIGATSQSDYYRFVVPAGVAAQASFSLSVAGFAPMLHGRLQLLDGSGNLVVDADDASNLSQSISTTLAPGTYYLVAKSFGQYGDVGQYTLAGTVTPSAPAVVGRFVFYNNSAFDGRDATANALDDQAIATGKSALLPGQTAQYANITNYSHGINGIDVDVANLPGTPTLGDFTFVAGNSSDPSTWTTAPGPTSILVRPGAGVGGSTRIELVWTDGSIINEWLGVTVKATAATGLASADTFYFGNLVGSATGAVVGSAFVVGAGDMTSISGDLHTFLNPAAITDPNDLNRDGRVDATDEVLERSNSGGSLVRLAPAAAPAASPATVTVQQSISQDSTASGVPSLVWGKARHGRRNRALV